MARKAILEGRITSCTRCRDPIVPDDFVGVSADEPGKLVHAGFHYTTRGKKLVICETGGIGSGYWDGTQVDGIGECLGMKALRKGKAQSLSGQGP